MAVRTTLVRVRPISNENIDIVETVGSLFTRRCFCFKHADIWLCLLRQLEDFEDIDSWKTHHKTMVALVSSRIFNYDRPRVRQMLPAIYKKITRRICVVCIAYCTEVK